MKHHNIIRHTVCSCTVAYILVGCVGIPSSTGPRSTFQMTPAISKGALAVVSARGTHANSTTGYKVLNEMLFATNTNAAYSDVTIYNPKSSDPSPLATITDGLAEPLGDCLDADGKLYVTNDPGSGLGWISEYALGSTKQLTTITNGINIPAFCAIDSQGNLWVANFGGPNVTEYLKGSLEPHTILTDGLTAPNSVAIDRAGRVYVGNLEPYGTSNIQVFLHGRKLPSRTITDGITFPEGIAVDAKSNLYVTNGYEPCNVEEYRVNQSTPYRALTQNINAPSDVTFAKNGWMYVLNDGNEKCDGPYPAVLEFKHGSTKQSPRMITKDLQNPSGVAYYPPLLP